MSIRQRLWTMARAELNSILDKTAERIRRGVDDAGEDARDRWEQVVADDRGGERIRQYYANLELAPGAPWPEVKSAYRRLMSRYHPDRHARDPEKVRIANEVSQQLRDAYEGLREHLKGVGPGR